MHFEAHLVIAELPPPPDCAAGDDAPPLPLGVAAAARLGARGPLAPLRPRRRQRARNLEI